MIKNKHLEGRQWQKTLAVTGLVTSGLMLGTLGNVQAHADNQDTNAVTTPSAQSSSDGAAQQPSQEVTLKAGKTTSVKQTKASDVSATSEGAEGNPDAMTTEPTIHAPTPQKPESVTSPKVANVPTTLTIHTPEKATTVEATPANNVKVTKSTAVPEAVAVAPTTTSKEASLAALSQWMPDANLQQIVLRALQKQQAQNNEPQYTDASQITKADVAGLKSINDTEFRYPNSDRPFRGPWYYGILNVTKLTGLEQATSLTQLILTTGDQDTDDKWTPSKLSDLTPLQNLTQLTDLNISDADISDITPLTKLTNLTSLVARHNKIKDISPLAGMAKLTNLDMDYNQIEDITAVGGMSSLSDLTLQRNQIKNIKPLAKLTQPMDMVMLDNNHILDVSPLANLNIRNLNCQIKCNTHNPFLSIGLA